MVEIYERWSRSDVSGFLQHLQSRDPNEPRVEALVRSALVLAAEADPQGTLRLAQNVRGRIGFVAGTAAVQALAASNPASAPVLLESALASGLAMTSQDRNSLINSFATGYARGDIDAAIAWKDSLDPPSAGADFAVMMTLASTDLARAIDVELTKTASAPIPTWLLASMNSNLRDPALIAQRVKNAGSGSRENAILAGVLMRWVEADPTAAVSWMQAHRDLPSSLLQPVVQRIVEYGSVEHALAVADMMPAAARGVWIEEAIVTAAEHDATAAIRITQRFRGSLFMNPR